MKILLFCVLLFGAWVKTEGTNDTKGVKNVFDDAGTNNTKGIKFDDAAEGNNTKGVKTVYDDAGANNTKGVKIVDDDAAEGTNNTKGVKTVYGDAGTNNTKGIKIADDAAEGNNNTKGVKTVYDDAGVNNTKGVKTVDDAAEGTNNTKGVKTVYGDAGTNNTKGVKFVADDAAEGTNNTKGVKTAYDDAAGPAGCWESKNGRLFKFVKSSVSWAKAQHHCLLLGGNLATIHNNEEEEFLQILAEGQLAWIAFTDAQEDGYWFWMTSDPVTYTNWCNGEPNNAGGPQQCALINFSGNKCWDDQRCSKNRPFLCEKRVYKS